MTKRKVNIWPYLLVAPALIIVVAVVFVPLIQAILMSFQSYDLRRPHDIALNGLANYAEMLQDPLFWNALWRTLVWVIAGVGFQFLFGFILALLLNQKFKGRGVIRAISLIPWCTPGVLIGLMWRWIYDGNYGVLNDILTKLHLIDQSIPFLGQKDTAFIAVIVTIIWQGIPFFALMIMAGLQSVPQEMYEAADIDGATWFQKLFRLTIPSIKNSLFVTLLLRIIWVANSVDVIYNMTSGGPAYSTQTLSVYIFQQGNSLNMGYASAMSIVLAILLAFVAVPYLIHTFRGEK